MCTVDDCEEEWTPWRLDSVFRDCVLGAVLYLCTHIYIYVHQTRQKLIK